MFYKFEFENIVYYVAEPVEKSLDDLAELCAIQMNPLLTYFDGRIWFIRVGEYPNLKNGGVIYVVKPVVYARVRKYFKYLVFSREGSYLTDDISNITGREHPIRILNEEPKGCIEAELIKAIIRGEINERSEGVESLSKR
jgi:hypothetical protein